MEIRVLRYFLAIAKEESVSGAAKALNITQPTLSKQLMELEQELNTTLFLREHRKMVLTNSGKLLKKRAQEIVELIDKSENEILCADTIVGGSISIGCGETEAMRFVTKAAIKVLEKNPSIQYDIYSATAEDVMERLDNGLLDFGIVIGDINIKKYNSLLLPMADTWGILSRKDSAFSAVDSVHKEDLLKVPLIFSKQALQEDELSTWFGENYTNLNIVATYNLIHNASIMVEEGVGVALCLGRLVNTSTISNFSFAPLDPKIEAPLHIIWKKSMTFSKASEEFLKTLKLLCKS